MARTEYVMFFPKVEIPEVPESAYSNILKHGRALSSEISNFQKPIHFISLFSVYCIFTIILPDVLRIAKLVVWNWIYICISTF